MASFEESNLFTLYNLSLKEDELECKTVIGSGGFAEVFVQNLCIGNSQEKKTYAIKRILKNNHAFPRKHYEREIKIFSRLAAQEARVSAPSPIYFPSIKKNLFSTPDYFSTVNTLCSFAGCTPTKVMCIYLWTI